MIRIRLDTHIRLRLTELDGRLRHSIHKALQFDNPEKIAAKAEHLYGWQDLPDKVTLWSEGDGLLVLPRGFLSRLTNGLDGAGYDWELDDDRIEVVRDWDLEGAITPVAMDPQRDQPNALAALLSHEQGILMAPPGMGKTQVGLELARVTKQKTLIIVENTHIARQWRERAMDVLGVELGTIGDTDEGPRDITVAMRQALWSRLEQYDADEFWDEWGMVEVDEVHHAQAMALSQLTQRFRARYRIGFSATPDRGDGNFPITAATVGAVVYKVSKLQLVNNGVLVKPVVRPVNTKFRFNFHPSEIWRPTREAPVCWCGNDRVHRHNNNYAKMMTALVNDPKRNALIADEIMERWPDRQLVVSKRLAHLDNIRDALIARGYPAEHVLMLTGAQDSEERIQAGLHMRDHAAVMLATVADEAFDVPRLEVIHIVFPTASPAVITQQVGRVERYAPGKTRAEIVDYVDGVSVLRRQARTRAKVYEAEGYTVKSSG